MISKRERGRMERRLAASLTRACEEAKPVVPGFCWLTHSVDYERFPESLVVTWVFDTQARLATALKGRDQSYMADLTAEALAELGLDLRNVERHVDFDCEEECQRVHGGDWNLRLKNRPLRH